MGGGSLNLEILRGGGAQAVLEIQVEGGSKNRSWRRRGVDFFWNNPLLICFVCLFFFFSFPNWLLSILSFFCGHKLASAVRGSTIYL